MMSESKGSIVTKMSSTPHTEGDPESIEIGDMAATTPLHTTTDYPIFVAAVLITAPFLARVQ